ncbi:MAG: indole-3-glycerol-phosphate synthase [Planctomycetes bacterium]|nr:indole-3-glycerol-phosphate synthase [Planctomycetota bacterium]
MADFLREMADASAERAAAAEELFPAEMLFRSAFEQPPTRQINFKRGELAVIAEIKRASPAAGVFNHDVDVAAQAKAYRSAGASAVSVLTEPVKFLGRDEDVREAQVAGLPVMRKDFLVSEYQVAQARLLGADGVLLIAGILSDVYLRKMLRLAGELGMFALVEAFDERDLQRALTAGANLIGVNCRNLRDLSVDFSRFEKLRPRIPAAVKAVAESGITTPEQFKTVKNLGYDGVLIGSALMKEGDAGKTLARLRA